jgi:UDPglucose 6-dehydrogenase
MRLTIAGYGYVGTAVYEAFSTIYTTNVVDPKINNTTISDTAPDAVIICVSTPESTDGSCDMSNVISVVESTAWNVPILIKSTISLKGWKELKRAYPTRSFTFSPEFLRADTATEDFLKQEYAIFAGDDAAVWAEIFKQRWPYLNTYISSPEEAITIKYAENSFLAVKVSFFNQLYDFCDKSNLNFNVVRKLLCTDNRIGHDHSFVTEERGWAGHCFPKDTSEFLKAAEDCNCDLSILKTTVEYNNKIRKNA